MPRQHQHHQARIRMCLSFPSPTALTSTRSWAIRTLQQPVSPGIDALTKFRLCNEITSSIRSQVMWETATLATVQQVRSPVYNDAQSFFRAKDQNEVVVSAMAKQQKYKVECRRLRKQKRATLYVLRLLEQKILELSGSNATAEKIDPTAPGYEMHPEVYKILKEGHTAMKGCRGVQTGF